MHEGAKLRVFCSHAVGEPWAWEVGEEGEREVPKD
jgi:hypothetical protein